MLALGPYPEITLASARQKRDDAKRLIAEGIDPSQKRKDDKLAAVNDPNELHEFLLDKCAPVVVMKITGRKNTVEVERKKRTSGGHSLTMTAGEMSDYMAKCAMLTGYPLPTPEELEEMGYISNTKPLTPRTVPYPTDYQEPKF